MGAIFGPDYRGPSLSPFLSAHVCTHVSDMRYESARIGTVLSSKQDRLPGGRGLASVLVTVPRVGWIGGLAAPPVLGQRDL
jgi:hypothetical protein